MADALRTAAEILGYTGSTLPGPGRVRKHAQGMAMQAMGEAAYLEAKREIMRTAEELMTALAYGLDDAEPLLMGRAAEGNTDAGVTLHVRVYTSRSTAEIAATLIEFGYDEPQFDTVQTKYGPINRIFLEEDGVPIVIARCLPQSGIARGVDMFTGERIAHTTVDELRVRFG